VLAPTFASEEVEEEVGEEEENEYTSIDEVRDEQSLLGQESERIQSQTNVSHSEGQHPPSQEPMRFVGKGRRSCTIRLEEAIRKDTDEWLSSADDGDYETDDLVCSVEVSGDHNHSDDERCSCTYHSERVDCTVNIEPPGATMSNCFFTSSGT